MSIDPNKLTYPKAIDLSPPTSPKSQRRLAALNLFGFLHKSKVKTESPPPVKQKSASNNPSPKTPMLKTQSLEAVHSIQKTPLGKTAKTQSLEIVHSAVDKTTPEKKRLGQTQKSLSLDSVHSSLTQSPKIDFDHIDPKSGIYLAFAYYLKKHYSFENLDFLVEFQKIDLSAPMNNHSKAQVKALIEKFILENKKESEDEINIEGTIHRELIASYHHMDNQEEYSKIIINLNKAKEEVKTMLKESFFEFAKTK